MKAKLIICTLSIIALFGLSACSSDVSADLLKSGKDRVEDPSVGQSSLATQVSGNNEFAISLYNYLSGTQNGNFLYSPYSISIALAMTYAGADGETKTQMADTLKYALPDSELHSVFNYIDQKLNSRSEGEAKVELSVVNAIWGQKEFKFLDGFLDTIAENYGAGLRLLDFEKSAEQARKTINEWVSDNTNDRIKDLIPSGGVDSLTRLVLTNAIYFNASWANPFDEEMTKNGTFTLLNGDKVTVDMMHQTEHFNYFEAEGYRVIELPYDGNELSMYIIIPDEGNFSQFESEFNAGNISSLTDNMEYKNVSLALPKFSFESSFNLNDALSTLGMPEAFTSSADFSKMTGGKDLFIGNVFHKTFISTDEAGTEAAAATAVVMTLTGMPELPVEVTIDSPFIFTITDNETGANIFLGRVCDPTSK